MLLRFSIYNNVTNMYILNTSISLFNEQTLVNHYSPSSQDLDFGYKKSLGMKTMELKCLSTKVLRLHGIRLTVSFTVSYPRVSLE